MAQRTAFLNSSASGYNQDFHHTWIHNYLLGQVGVMFTDYTTKPDFALGNGQIAGGKAIIKVTRTTGNFAGSEILALFESTGVEPISTSGNKKVFIEIDPSFVNDSMSIDDATTQGQNLGVGVIKSETSYPAHSNYIPLWEITGGNWATAVDKRPEILRKGKPNTISFFGNDGKEHRLELNAGSLNKFIKSNGAGVAPSWADMSGTVEVTNLKGTFYAGEDILPNSMFMVEGRAISLEATTAVDFGKNVNTQKAQINAIANGATFNKIYVNLGKVNDPADNVNIRIETVNASGNATGTLIHSNAYGTITPAQLSTLDEVEITLNGNVSSVAAGTRCAVVFSRAGSTSLTNYFTIGAVAQDTGIWTVRSYNGTSWAKEVGKKGYVRSAGLMDEASIQAKATSNYLTDATGYSPAGASAGNDFTGVRLGMVDVPGFGAGEKVFLSDTGVLSNTPGAVSKVVGTGIDAGVVDIFGDSKGGSGIGGYDAVVAADGSGDYTTVTDAINNNKDKIYVKNGAYAETYRDIRNKDITVTGETPQGVQITFTGTVSGRQCYVDIDGAKSFVMSNLTFNTPNIPDYHNAISTGNSGNADFVEVTNCYFTYGTDSIGTSKGLIRTLMENSSNNLGGEMAIFRNCTFYTDSPNYSGNEGITVGTTNHTFFDNCLFTTGASSGLVRINGKIMNSLFRSVYGYNVYSPLISNTKLTEVTGAYGGIIVSDGLVDSNIKSDKSTDSKISLYSSTNSIIKGGSGTEIELLSKSDYGRYAGTTFVGENINISPSKSIEFSSCYFEIVGSNKITFSGSENYAISACIFYSNTYIDNLGGYFEFAGCRLNKLEVESGVGWVHLSGCTVGNIESNRSMNISGSNVSQFTSDKSIVFSGNRATKITHSGGNGYFNGNYITGDVSLSGNKYTFTGNRSNGTVTIQSGSQRVVVVANTMYNFTDNGISTEKAYNDTGSF